MRRLLVLCLLLAVSGGVLVQESVAETKHRIGVGAHYWTVLGDIDVTDETVDESGLGYLVSYQLRPVSLVGIEIDIEMLPENYGGATEEVFAPQAYVIVGSGLYAGLGIGRYFTDGAFTDSTFYAVRAGVNFSLFPYITLDVNANYRFDDWDDINTIEDDITKDTVTIGAAVRIEL
ncbi:MAG: hypothetical protein HN341_09340 [Verrucomicrobia bacterium]|mgnify:CR=1 FL=1|jgi:hypothetical protein|nr:hypothetical protein [Verrucomicrobiota bacterium]